LPSAFCLYNFAMQIILFDIDGTLIQTGGAGQSAMDKVSFEQGTREADSTRVKYAGRTDRSIIRDHLQMFGIDETPENYALYQADFLKKLPQQLATRAGTVLPAVTAVLDRLCQHPFELGLITGNMRAAARLKLEHYELSEYFFTRNNGNGRPEAMGGFGDDHFDRDDMAREALGDVQRHMGEHFSGEQIWVVGDTPRDVQCARAIGARVLAVATGSYSFDELAETSPDLICESLEQADHWWQQLGL
jgi:phosphoglycolate phosphatase-like HAD superfamily hydrolase